MSCWFGVLAAVFVCSTARLGGSGVELGRLICHWVPSWRGPKLLMPTPDTPFSLSMNTLEVDEVV